MTYILSRKKQLVSVVLSVVFSFLLVAMVASAVTYIDTDSVGIGTSTPGAALGVKGGALIDGFLVADYIRATSTTASSIGGNLGLASTTPGAMLAVKGFTIHDGGVWADYIVATSTSIAMGFGTSTPGAEFSVDGGALFGGGMTVSYLKSTSTVTSSFGGNLGIGATTSPGLMFGLEGYGNVKGDFNIAGTSTLSSIIATSTVNVGTSTPTVGAQLNVAGSGYLSSGLGVGAATTSTGGFIVKGSTLGFIVDGASNRVAIGTSTLPGDNPEGTNVAPDLTVSGSASSTVFLAAEGGGGSQIILKSTDGNRCVAIQSTAGTGAIGTAATLTVKIVGCPDN